MRPVHTLHLYQADDRFATVVTSGSSHRFCGARQIGGIAWLLLYAKNQWHRPILSLAKISGIGCYCRLRYQSPHPACTFSRRLLATAIPVGATRGTRVAMRPVHTLHIYQPNDRFRHRRNLRQLPQVM